MVSIDLQDAFEFPRRGDDAVKTHLIGGGVPTALNLVALPIMFLSIIFFPLAFLSFLLVPFQIAIGVVWTGYVLRVVRRTYAGEREPPRFEDWEDLARDGLRGFLIVLVYQLPGFVLGAITFALTFVVFLGAGVVGSESDAGGAALSLVGVLVLGIAFLVVMGYYLLVTYVLPIALCAYADTGRIGAAFSWDRISRVGFDADYAVTWAVAAGVYLVGAAVLSAVFVGYVFLPFLYFYLAVAAFYAFAQIYADVLRVEAEPAA